MLESSSPPNISSDRPISSGADDVLGRSGFAQALANLFIQWKGEDSLVVALYGPWGSGKSSVKNMILESIEKGDSRPTVIEFNPWAWSGRDRLLSAFFEEVGIVIGNKPGASEAKDLAGRWRRYGARLNLAGTSLAAIKPLAFLLAGPLASLGVGAAGLAAEQIADIAKKAAEAHDTGSEEKSLEELKEDLSSELSKLDTSLLIVIDDVDRLTTEEIRLLFQVIKINADFPRVVYFLLFDRGVVERALDGVAGSSGAVYLEKIVQAGFDLPKYDQDDLDDMVTRGLSLVLRSRNVDHTVDHGRWSMLYHFALRSMLATPRDVQRLLSSLSFTIGLFLHEGVLEVNTIDMIAIETLRVFEPALYHQLPRERDLLLGNDSWDESQREKRKEKLKRLLGLASKQRSDAVRGVLGDLFPPAGRLLGSPLMQMGSELDWMRSRRICHRSLFDRYFALCLPKWDVPSSLIDQVLSVLGDRNEIHRELISLEKSGQLVAALKRIAAHIPELDVKHASPFIATLMDVGESLPDRVEERLGGPDMTAYFIVYDYLKRIDDAGTRSSILLKAISETEGLYLPLQVISLDRERRERNDPLAPPLLDDSSWEKAKKLCIYRLKQWSKDGRLLSPKLETYLWRWKDLADVSAPKNYVTTLTSTPDGTLRFLRSLAHDVWSQGLSGVAPQAKRMYSANAIETFASMSRIESKLKPLLGDNIPDELVPLAEDYKEELAGFRQRVPRKKPRKKRPRADGKKHQ